MEDVGRLLNVGCDGDDDFVGEIGVLGHDGHGTKIFRGRWLGITLWGGHVFSLLSFLLLCCVFLNLSLKDNGLRHTYLFRVDLCSRAGGET